MRQQLSPARFFSEGAPRPGHDRAAAQRAALDARERDRARASEWIHLRTWMRLGQGSAARAAAG